MKKVLAVIIFSVILVCSLQNEAQAQTEGYEIGLRFANGNDIAFDFAMPLGANRLHANVNFFKGGIGVAGIYDWQFPFAEGFMFYPGIGASISIFDNPLGGTDLGLAIGGEVGVEYQFDFPLTLGLDYQPMFDILNNGGYADGWGLNARWRF